MLSAVQARSIMSGLWDSTRSSAGVKTRLNLRRVRVHLPVANSLSRAVYSVLESSRARNSLVGNLDGR